MPEMWRKINVPNLPDHYEISSHGRVRSLPYVDRRGWKRNLRIHRYTNAEIDLTLIDGSKKCFPVAALVLLTFHGPPNADQYLARHLDDDRCNNKLVNLAWGNDADNHADALRNGANYVSRGHLGKKHTEAMKQKMSLLRRGKQTGRKMTDAHRVAILAGYRKKFPVKQNA